MAPFVYRDDGVSDLANLSVDGVFQHSIKNTRRLTQSLNSAPSVFRRGRCRPIIAYCVLRRNSQTLVRRRCSLCGARTLATRPTSGLLIIVGKRNFKCPVLRKLDAYHLRPLRVCAVKRRRFSSGCEAHPVKAPAGSNRSNEGGNEFVEAFGEAVTTYGDGASVQAVTRVNAEQASKWTMCRPTQLPYWGRLIRLGD